MESTPGPLPPDENRAPEMLAILWIFTALALIIVILKIYTRFRIVQETGLDDILIFSSMVLSIICTALFTVDVGYGMGRHAVYLTPYEREQAVKINLIANPFGVMAYSLPNISVAIFLNRILAPNRPRKIALYIITIAQSVIAAISLVILFAQCSPTEFLWNPTIPATCLSPAVITGYSYFVGSYSAFTDLLLAIVPAAAFWKLQLRWKTKIGLCFLMGMTALAAIAAIVKTTKLYQLADLADFTYGTIDLIIWVQVESNTIIIAACIPSLRPFMISVSKSITNKNHRFFLGGSFLTKKGNSYVGKTYGSDYPLVPQAWPSSSSSNVKSKSGVESLDSRVEAGALPAHKIKRTTDIATEWETV